MNFEYDPARREEIARFRALCRERLVPLDDELAAASPRDAAAKVREGLPLLLTEGGLAGGFPAEYGGKSLPRVEAVAYWEALGATSASVFVATDASLALCAGAILAAGSRAQQERYLPGLLSGRLVGAFAAGEWTGGSDPAAVQTRATRDRNGWRVRGTKAPVTNALSADVVVFLAVTDRGRSLFVAEAKGEGIRVGEPESTMGLAGAGVAEVHFEDAPLPPDALLGGEGEGDRLVDGILDRARISFAAGAVGIASRIVDESLRYANERTAFGRTIFKHQEVAFKLADMRLLTDGARLLVQYAAWSADQGSPEIPSLAACAKLFASESATWIAGQGLQIHGGIGYLRRSAMERLFRDARFLEIGHGTSEILRGRIAAIELARAR